jgi:thiosulfate reductase cytochrome b subunit
VTPLRVLILMSGGIKFIVALHFMLACSLLAFLCTHVYLATLGSTPLAYIKPMVFGWEELPEHHDHEEGNEADSPDGYQPVRHYPECSQMHTEHGNH